MKSALKKEQNTPLTKNTLPFDGQAHLVENFIQDHNALFQELYRRTPWEQKKITLFGRTMNQPRLISWYSDPEVYYNYSNTIFQPKDWPENLKQLKNRLNKSFKTNFNSVLLNLYRDGNDSMGLHSDDEKELGKNPIIASISLGAVRAFRFKHKSKKNCVEKLYLKSGSLLLMSGETQHHWKHEVPKSKKILKPRINLTFRAIKN